MRLRRFLRGIKRFLREEVKNNLKNMSINEISYHIRGAVYDVYKALGPGLLESVYEEALCFELEERGLKVDRQVQVPIYIRVGL